MAGSQDRLLLHLQIRHVVDSGKHLARMLVDTCPSGLGTTTISQQHSLSPALRHQQSLLLRKVCSPAFDSAHGDGQGVAHTDKLPIWLQSALFGQVDEVVDVRIHGRVEHVELTRHEGRRCAIKDADPEGDVEMECERCSLVEFGQRLEYAQHALDEVASSNDVFRVVGCHDADALYSRPLDVGCKMGWIWKGGALDECIESINGMA